MKKIDLNKPFRDLDGKEMPGNTLAKELAIGLSRQSNVSNPLKVYEWCERLHKKGSIELDTTDFDEFKQCVVNAQNFTVIFKGQILREIMEQK